MNLEVVNNQIIITLDENNKDVIHRLHQTIEEQSDRIYQLEIKNDKLKHKLKKYKQSNKCISDGFTMDDIQLEDEQKWTLCSDCDGEDYNFHNPPVDCYKAYNNDFNISQLISNADDEITTKVNPQEVMIKQLQDKINQLEVELDKYKQDKLSDVRPSDRCSPCGTDKRSNQLEEWLYAQDKAKQRLREEVICKDDKLMPGFKNSGIRYSYQPKIETLQHITKSENSYFKDSLTCDANPITKPQTILSSDPYNNNFVGGIVHDDGTVEYMTMKQFEEKLKQSKDLFPKESYDKFMKYFKDTTKITNIE